MVIKWTCWCTVITPKCPHMIWILCTVIKMLLQKYMYLFFLVGRYHLKGHFWREFKCLSLTATLRNSKHHLFIYLYSTYCAQYSLNVPLSPGGSPSPEFRIISGSDKGNGPVCSFKKKKRRSLIERGEEPGGTRSAWAGLPFLFQVRAEGGAARTDRLRLCGNGAARSSASRYIYIYLFMPFLCAFALHIFVVSVRHFLTTHWLR